MGETLRRRFISGVAENWGREQLKVVAELGATQGLTLRYLVSKTWPAATVDTIQTALDLGVSIEAGPHPPSLCSMLRDSEYAALFDTMVLYQDHSSGEYAWPHPLELLLFAEEQEERKVDIAQFVQHLNAALQRRPLPLL